MSYVTTVFKRSGAIWTRYELDDYLKVVRLADEWFLQPGTESVVVEENGQVLIHHRRGHDAPAR